MATGSSSFSGKWNPGDDFCSGDGVELEGKIVDVSGLAQPTAQPAEPPREEPKCKV